MTITALAFALHTADLPSPSPTPTLPRELDPSVVTPGLVGLAFFVVLFVVLFFLMRSFTRQLKKIDVPADHDESVSQSVVNHTEDGLGT